MEEERREELLRQLGIMDISQKFLALLVLAICLSAGGISRQKEDIFCLLRGGTPEPADLSAQKAVTNAIAVGALTFFFLVTLDGWRQSAGQEQGGQDSARWNLWAALLALAAALIRLWDLARTQERREQGEES